jgi:hypothetical protein
MLYNNWIKVKNVSITSAARKYFHAFIRVVAFTAIAITGTMYVLALIRERTAF